MKIGEINLHHFQFKVFVLVSQYGNISLRVFKDHEAVFLMLPWKMVFIHYVHVG